MSQPFMQLGCKLGGTVLGNDANQMGVLSMDIDPAGSPLAVVKIYLGMTFPFSLIICIITILL